jgi:WD40 repeat protein
LISVEATIRAARRAARLLLACLTLAVGAAEAQPRPAPSFSPAAAPPTEPFLRIEAGRHTGGVNRIAVDRAGQLLATASDDKTVRLWNAADGAPRGVLRLPIGPREEGEVFAVALTPDGKWAFAAGYTGYAWDRNFSIYRFNLETMMLQGRVSGLPAPVNHLAISADGARLAAGLGGNTGIRVWDLRQFGQVFEDRVFQGPVRSLAFDVRGRLAAASADGRVRLYDQQYRRIADAVPEQGAQPFGLAFSPDADVIAVAYENRLKVDLLSARTLARIASPDVTGLSGEGLVTVAWAPDGKGSVQLYAAGYARGNDGYVVRRWSDFGLGAPTDIAAARDTIAHLIALPTGGVAYATADPGWGRIGADGTVAIRPEPPIASFRAAREGRFAISQDGYVVEFSGRARPLRFDALARRLAPAEGTSSLAPPRAGGSGLVLANIKDSNGPTLNGARLALGQSEFSRSAAVLPDGSGVLLGTDTHLRLFGRDGRQLAEVATPGAAWAVNVSGDGTVAVAGLADGTLRWYGLAQGERLVERAALYPHADGVRWVFWTPEGFFDHADAGGKEMVGVHLNRAANRAPEWVSFAQAYRALYAPGLVRARLQGDASSVRARMAEIGDIRQRLDRQPAVTILSICTPIPGAGCLPLAPDQVRVPPLAESLRITMRLSDRGLGVGAVDTFVNDRNVGRTQPAGVVAGASVDHTVDAPLDPGANEIQVRVYDSENGVFLETPPILVAAPVEPGQQQGRLFVLAVGIDKYAQPGADLNFAAADARTFVNTVRANTAGLFRNVEVATLFDAQATRANILAALERMASQVRPQDTFFLYMAAHGVRSPVDDKFLFVPHDTDRRTAQTLANSALAEGQLIAALAKIPARNGFLFMDTCYSGQITAETLANVGHETGRFLLTASTSVQEALDSYDGRNGVFGYAVKEALSGRAPRDEEGVISALSLGDFVARRVGQLAREKNHSQDAVFKSALRELRAFPVARVPR